VLARLAHPHIAHLIDAGVAAGSQPYLVLEYIEGEPIDRWCDRRELGVHRTSDAMGRATRRSVDADHPETGRAARLAAG
jgi:serine/threonine protein kinase